MKIDLLEQSRVTSQPTGERNYHIFYQMTTGMSQKEKETYFVRDWKEYKYLSDKNAEMMEDDMEFASTKDSMSEIGLDEQQISFVFKVLSSILLLGNIAFAQVKSKVAISNRRLISEIATLLGIVAEKLEKCLCTKFIQAGNDVMEASMNVEEAESTRDSVARLLYNSLFLWLVSKINLSLKVDPTKLSRGLKTIDVETAKNLNFIGILDIFGFENFKVCQKSNLISLQLKIPNFFQPLKKQTNSFEQLCINFANEKLHQLFIDHVVVQEQKEYLSEGIVWAEVQADQVKVTLELLEGKPRKSLGIFPLIDDICNDRSGTDTKLLEQMKQNLSSNPSFEVPKIGGNSKFIVKHYAENVIYDIKAFREKNQTKMPESLLKVLKESKSLLLNEIVSPPSHPSSSSPLLSSAPSPSQCVSQQPNKLELSSSTFSSA